MLFLRGYAHELSHVAVHLCGRWCRNTQKLGAPAINIDGFKLGGKPNSSEKNVAGVPFKARATGRDQGCHLTFSVTTKAWQNNQLMRRLLPLEEILQKQEGCVNVSISISITVMVRQCHCK